nr:hypothetical protein CFP56_34874 [Quercus suber]
MVTGNSSCTSMLSKNNKILSDAFSAIKTVYICIFFTRRVWLISFYFSNRSRSYAPSNAFSSEHVSLITRNLPRRDRSEWKEATRPVQYRNQSPTRGLASTGRCTFPEQRILPAPQPAPRLRHGAQLAQRLVHHALAVLRAPALKLNEEHIVPRRLAAGPAVDARQIDAERLEDGEGVRQRARPRVVQREREERLPARRVGHGRPRGRRQRRRRHRRRRVRRRGGQDQEACAVAPHVLDAARQHREPVRRSRETACDGGGARVCGGERGTCARRRDVLALGVRNVRGEEGLALAPGLRVGVEFGDISPVTRTVEAALAKRSRVKTTEPLEEFSKGTTPRVARPVCTVEKTPEILDCGDRAVWGGGKRESVALRRREEETLHVSEWLCRRHWLDWARRSRPRTGTGNREEAWNDGKKKKMTRRITWFKRNSPDRIWADGNRLENFQMNQEPCGDCSSNVCLAGT